MADKSDFAKLVSILALRGRASSHKSDFAKRVAMVQPSSEASDFAERVAMVP